MSEQIDQMQVDIDDKVNVLQSRQDPQHEQVVVPHLYTCGILKQNRVGNHLTLKLHL